MKALLPGLFLAILSLVTAEREIAVRRHVGRERVSTWTLRQLYRWARLWWCLACAGEAFVVTWRREKRTSEVEPRVDAES